MFLFGSILWHWRWNIFLSNLIWYLNWYVTVCGLTKKKKKTVKYSTKDAKGKYFNIISIYITFTVNFIIFGFKCYFIVLTPLILKKVLCRLEFDRWFSRKHCLYFAILRRYMHDFSFKIKQKIKSLVFETKMTSFSTANNIDNQIILLRNFSF